MSAWWIWARLRTADTFRNGNAEHSRRYSIPPYAEERRFLIPAHIDYMKNVLAILLAFLAFGTLSAREKDDFHGIFNHFGVYVSAGTEGIGTGVASPVISKQASALAQCPASR